MHRLGATAAVMAVTIVACNGILGIEDRPLRDDTSDGGEGGDGGDAGDAGASEASATSAYPAAIMADKPLVYLRFGEKSGTIGHDEMGHLDATYPPSGVTLGAAGALSNDSNTAIELDGTGVLHFPEGVDFEGLAPFSVEVWVRASAQGLGQYPYVIDHNLYEPRRGWDLLVGTQGVYFERWDVTVGPALGMEPPPPAETWHHVVGTFDGAMQMLFVDGSVVMTATVARAKLPRVTGGFTAGGQNCACSGLRFVGRLDELAIYDRALPAARVTAHYKAASP
jgi:hypothetical protein